MTGVLPGESGETVRTALADGVLVVRLDRPQAAHSRNQLMRDELGSLWRATASDRDVRAVVLTATGERFFCAGMDLKEADQAEDSVTRRDRMRRSRDIELLAGLPQPTVAAINGYALGGGLEMALACDMRVIADTAQVGLPEITRGLVPGGGGAQRLPRLIGYARARELVLTGRRLSAVESVHWGICSRTATPDELLPAANALARAITVHPEPAVRYAKTLLRRSQEGRARPWDRRRTGRSARPPACSADREPSINVTVDEPNPRTQYLGSPAVVVAPAETDDIRTELAAHPTIRPGAEGRTRRQHDAGYVWRTESRPG